MGGLDYTDRLLAKFDFVVASIHSRFKMSKKEQTYQILKAVENHHTIGHMTGRQLTRRPGYEIDTDKVLQACAQHGVAVEINAHPWRLDLDWRWHQKPLDYACIFSINPTRILSESLTISIGVSKWPTKAECLLIAFLMLCRSPNSCVIWSAGKNARHAA